MDDSFTPGNISQDDSSVENHVAEANLRWLRRTGIGILFAGMFVPFDLVVILAVLGVGLYLSIRAVLYLRDRLALHRLVG